MHPTSNSRLIIILFSTTIRWNEWNLMIDHTCQRICWTNHRGDGRSERGSPTGLQHASNRILGGVNEIIITSSENASLGCAYCSEQTGTQVSLKYSKTNHDKVRTFRLIGEFWLTQCESHWSTRIKRIASMFFKIKQ